MLPVPLHLKIGFAYIYLQGKTSDDDEEEGQLLGEYSYDTSGPPIQEYPVHVSCYHSHLPVQF